jgi:hypothetical protein
MVARAGWNEAVPQIRIFLEGRGNAKVERVGDKGRQIGPAVRANVVSPNAGLW